MELIFPEGNKAESIKLTLGLAVTPRTRALFDGSVRPEGIELRCESQFGDGLDNTGARHRAILGGAIDGGECSTSSLILARMRGSPLRGLPIFPARQFRHRCIYCPASSTLSHPSELKGKNVVAHRYNATTAVWLRGLLQNEYGVSPEEMKWYVAEPDVGEEAANPPPKSVTVNFIPPPRTREHALKLVENGTLDAALEPYNSLAKNPKLRRLLKDHRREEADYFGRTQVIPVIHTLVLQEELIAKQPWILESLLAAFRKARALDQKYMTEEERNEARWLSEAIGYDPYVYSFDDSTRKSLDALIRCQIQQGLLNRQPALEELFFRETLSA
jgi:4,5-dihydroxyphthalate decarboxylase